LGYIKYNKSSIKSNILKDEYIGNSLLKYTKYKYKDKYKVSQNLYNARLFELKLYYL